MVLVGLVDIDIVDLVDVIDEAFCREFVDVEVLVVLLVLLQVVVVEDGDSCEEVLDDRGAGVQVVI